VSKRVREERGGGKNSAYEFPSTPHRVKSQGQGWSGWKRSEEQLTPHRESLRGSHIVEREGKK